MRAGPADIDGVIWEDAFSRPLWRIAPFAGACCLAWIAVLVGSGIAVQQPGEALQATTERADAALYRAKTHGRDQARMAADDRPRQSAGKQRHA